MLAYLHGRKAAHLFSSNKVLKNKHQAVSEADMGWRLGGWKDRRLRKDIVVFLQASQLPSFQASQPYSFRHTTHLQKPRNAGSRLEAPFFNTLLHID
jgi:hypothetical protein